jgi:hypothetical protein
MNEKLKVSDGLKVWIQDFLDSSAPQFKGKSPKERIKMAIAAFRDAGGKLKEGNMKERMDQSKLTGQEISVYFRKNPKAGKDKLVKKAVEFALDHGGAMSYAIKGIEKMKRGLTKHPEVKKALRYANESVHHESVWTVKGIVQENYTRNFETLCNSLKLNGIQQKILDDFIHKGRIRDQYVGRVAGSRKETRIFAGKKKFTGSIDNRSEALMNALKVNAKQKSILDAYLKTGKVIGKYTGSIAGSTKDTKSYTGFRGFKEHFEIEEKVGQMRSWKKGWDPAEEEQLRKDKKLKKDLETYAKKKNQIKKIKDAEKLIPYLLNHINTNFGDGKGGKLSDEKFHQLANAINFYYDYDYLWYEQVNERRYGKSMSRKDIMRKHGNEFKKALRKGSLELSDKAEGDLIQYIMDNHPEEIRTDDPDEWVEWLDDNLEDFVKGKGY